MWTYIFGETIAIKEENKKDENKQDKNDENNESSTKNDKDEKEEIDLSKLTITEYLYLVSIDNNKNIIFDNREKAMKYVHSYASKYTCNENYYLYYVLNDCFNNVDEDTEVYKIMKSSNMYLISYDTHISTIKVIKTPKMNV